MAATVSISPGIISIGAGGYRSRLLDHRNALIKKHLGLVPSIAHRIKERLPPSFELADLIQEGRIGLMRAAARYRPEKHNGTPFSAYARPRIHGAIVDSVRRRCWIENTAFPLDDAPEPVHHRTMPFLIRGPHLAGPKRRAGTPHAFRPDHLPKPLVRALRALTARQRAILGAFYGDGGSLPEIAATLHLPVALIVDEHRAALDSLHARVVQNVSKSGLTLVYFSQSRAA